MRRVALLLAVAVTAGCSGDRSSPPASPISPSSPAATLARVWLCCGSNQIVINTERQIEVRATYSDGSSRDVTSTASGWKSSNPRIVSVSDKGVVRAIADGAVDIRASYQGIDATWNLWVAGDRYRQAAPDEVIGFVRHLTVNGPVYIWHAEVEVAGGERDGMRTQTDVDGLFRISGFMAPGFDLLIREAAYSSRRIHVSELGRDLSAETEMTPAPTMVEEVLEGAVCWPSRTISTTFTPAMPGFLRITSTRFASTLREVYEDGTRVTPHLTNNTDLQTGAGRRYELRLIGSCDYDPSPNVRLTFLRPR